MIKYKYYKKTPKKIHFAGKPIFFFRDLFILGKNNLGNLATTTTLLERFTTSPVAYGQIK